MKIDHIGVAVEDLDAAMAIYRTLLGTDTPITREMVPEQKVEIAAFSIGSARLELMASTDPQGAVGRFLAKRGPGLHHLALAVDDLSAELDRLDRAGVQLIDRQPRAGGMGTQVAFVHPRSSGGVLLELVEHGEA